MRREDDGESECMGEEDGEAKRSPKGTSTMSIVVESEGSMSVDLGGESRCVCCLC